MGEGLWTLTTKLAAHTRAKNTNLIIIPPRITNLLQPADVCWFYKFKKAYLAKWVEWSLNSMKVNHQTMQLL